MINNDSLSQVIQAFVNKGVQSVHTMTVGRVVKVNAKTIDVQPVINKTLNGNTIIMPLLEDVPPIFMQGGGSSETYPIAAGDYCLLFVAESCFDQWYAGTDEVEPLEDRMHDYSDSFAIVGINPYASALTIPTTTTATGDKIIEGDYTQTGDYTQFGNRTQTGNFLLTGTLTVIGDIVLNGRSLQGFMTGHTHGTSPPPNPAP